MKVNEISHLSLFLVLLVGVDFFSNMQIADVLRFLTAGISRLNLKKSNRQAISSVKNVYRELMKVQRNFIALWLEPHKYKFLNI